ncbi:MAG: hypothetical protein WCX30_01065 [Candidatus Paceibacterota bacterium]|jgi:hypothetical protein
MKNIKKVIMRQRNDLRKKFSKKLSERDQRRKGMLIKGRRYVS